VVDIPHCKRKTASFSGIFPHFLNSPAVSVSGVSGVSLFQVCAVFPPNTAHIARYFFGDVELILTFVAIVAIVAVVSGHLGSWMIFISLCLSFCEVEKGL
jgi:hypothetical protein